MMSTLPTMSRRASAVAAAAVLALGLTACSSDDNPEDANAAAASAAEEAIRELNESTTTPANDPGTPHISADKTQDLVDGEQITVTVHDLASSGGYYLSIYKEGTGADSAGTGGAPDCTGDRSSSKWLTAEGSEKGTDHFDAEGTAEVTLTVAEKGDAVDCATDTCVLKVFGDHTNGFRAVAEAPVTFAD